MGPPQGGPSCPSVSPWGRLLPVVQSYFIRLPVGGILHLHGLSTSVRPDKSFLIARFCGISPPGPPSHPPPTLLIPPEPSLRPRCPLLALGAVPIPRGPYPRPDLFGLPGAYYLCQCDVYKDDGPLRFPAPVVDPSPFYHQAHSETLSNHLGRSRILTGQLGGQLLPATLPQCVLCDSPIRVGPIIVL